MAYNIKDIIDSLIILENNGYKLYCDIANSNLSSSRRIKTAAQVLAQEEQRHADVLRDVKTNLGSNEEEIDILLYDKIHSLIIEFNSFFSKPIIENVGQLLQFAYEFEKSTIALLVNIQGRLIRNASVLYSYSVIHQLLMDEEKHMRNLESFLRASQGL